MFETIDNGSKGRPIGVAETTSDRYVAPTGRLRRRLITRIPKSMAERTIGPQGAFDSKSEIADLAVAGSGGLLLTSADLNAARPRVTALVVDDHALFRAGLSSMLRRDCGCGEVLEATGMDEAMTILSTRSDVVLGTFDIGAPVLSSVRDLTRFRRAFPRLRIAVITDLSQRNDILLALSAGAHGYILKEWSTQRIGEAIRSVVSGRVSVPSTVADIGPPPTETVQWGVQALSHEDRTVRLSARQAEVLHLIVAGNSNKEIARRLGLSEHTVKIHASAIYRVIGVRNRVAAAVFSEERHER